MQAHRIFIAVNLKAFQHPHQAFHQHPAHLQTCRHTMSARLTHISRSLFFHFSLLDDFSNKLVSRAIDDHIDRNAKYTYTVREV